MINSTSSPKTNIFSISHVSIKKRLPFLIFILLFATILTFSGVAYIVMRSTSLEAGKDRITNLGTQLAAMFQLSINNLLAKEQTFANQKTVKVLLQSPAPANKLEMRQELKKYAQSDSLFRFIQVFGLQRAPVLAYGEARVEKLINEIPTTQRFGPDTSSANVGQFHLLNDSLYYPITAPVRDENKLIGRIVKWRIMRSTKKNVEQLAQLLGASGKLYFGNDDGRTWTDMFKLVSRPFVNIRNLKKISEYRDKNGTLFMATVRPIPNSHWLILVELSESAFLITVNIFLKWISIIGVILIIVGSFAAWLMSLHITRPLIELTNASASIAHGDYTSMVSVKARDELGILAASFNGMILQIHAARQGLEQKILERTIELESANKELESFAYSVSHDLRTPLRAINGYSMMLKDDFENKLGDDGNRKINIIMSNANLMGKLIDDLLEFSRLGRKGIKMQCVPMNALAKECLAQLLENDSGRYQVKITQLPACKGDANMLKQVWMNLIGNAVKYASKTEQPLIEIGFTTGANITTYFVKDNGVGFDMQHAHKLFGVFHRLHGNSEFEGTGVGLALVKRIIEKHQGSIAAEAIPNQGATFYFSIPV